MEKQNNGVSEQSIAMLRDLRIALNDANGKFRNLVDVLNDISAHWESYPESSKRIVAEAFAGGGNVAKFHDAMNTLAKRSCGVSDAYNNEQAVDMLKTWTEQNGGNEDLAVARMCELAYGTENVTFKDAMLIIDDEIRKGVKACGTSLKEEQIGEWTMTDVVDILVRHWKDFTDAEKIVIGRAVTGELSHVEPATTT